MATPRFTVAVILLLCLPIALVALPPSQATSAVFEVEGCEAADMQALLGARHPSRWHGPARDLGTWRATHFLEVSCDKELCTGDGGLEMRFRNDQRPPDAERADVMAPDDDVTDPASLPTARRQLVERRSITGESARTLMRAIGVRAFEDDAGRIHFVWGDYGRLATPLRIRGRSEATCDLSNLACSIDTTLLFFIDYDEHHECGYLSKSRQKP